MMYYMGQEFDKEKCKEYKTLNAAEKAAEKQKAAVFDEAGEMVVDFRPAATEEFDGVQAVRVKGKIKRLFKGAIRVRNKPSWSPHVVRAAAAFDTKDVTHVLNVDGKPMYRTKDGYFITGEPELVEYIEEK